MTPPTPPPTPPPSRDQLHAAALAASLVAATVQGHAALRAELLAGVRVAELPNLLLATLDLASTFAANAPPDAVAGVLLAAQRAPLAPHPDDDPPNG